MKDTTNGRQDGRIKGKQLKAIEALFTGASVPDAAAAAGISVRQLYRWRTEDPAFMAEMANHSQAQLENSRMRLMASFDLATDVLREIAADPGQPGSVRVRAAVALHRLGLDAHEAAEIIERIKAIEEILDKR